MDVLRDFRDVILAIFNANLDWHRKSAREKCLLLYRIGRVCGDLIGLRFLNDLRIVWWSYLSAVMCSTYGILTIYTIYYFTAKNRFSESIPSTCMSGIVVSVCYFFSVKRFQVFNFRIFSVYLCLRNKHECKAFSHE